MISSELDGRVALTICVNAIAPGSVETRMMDEVIGQVLPINGGEVIVGI